MNANDVQYNSAVAFSISIIVATTLLLFQIPIARRIARIMDDETSTKCARRTLYGICSTLVGLCLAEMTKATLFGLFYYHADSLFATM
jgi:hypothetical protein